MIPASRVARAALRAPRVRTCGFRNQQLRFESSANPSAAGAGGTRASNPHLWSGVAGGFIGADLFYAVYSFTPAGRAASKINKAAKDANEKYQQLVKQLQQNAPDSDQAVEAVRKFAYTYVAWISGGRAYVDAAFKDWETIRSNHREEADKVVKETYKQLQDLSKAGLNYDTASKAYDVLADFSKKITDLAGSAMSELIENHPQVKEKLGGGVDQLKRLGQRYGPDAQKQIDATWAQVKNIFAGGISASNLEKARKLIQDKVKELSRLSDKAWNKALEEAKPYLDKNPKIKDS